MILKSLIRNLVVRSLFEEDPDRVGVYERHHLSHEHYQILAIKFALTQKYSASKSQHC